MLCLTCCCALLGPWLREREGREREGRDLCPLPRLPLAKHPRAGVHPLECIAVMPSQAHWQGQGATAPRAILGPLGERRTCIEQRDQLGTLRNLPKKSPSPTCCRPAAAAASCRRPRTEDLPADSALHFKSTCCGQPDGLDSGRRTSVLANRPVDPNNNNNPPFPGPELSNAPVVHHAMINPLNKKPEPFAARHRTC